MNELNQPKEKLGTAATTGLTDKTQMELKGLSTIERLAH